MKTVAIIFLSVIGVFVTCGHEALIELTPGAKKETVPSFGEQIEWLLDYEYHWKELESVRESFRFKTPEGASVERKKYCRFERTSDAQWKNNDEPFEWGKRSFLELDR